MKAGDLNFVRISLSYRFQCLLVLMPDALSTHQEPGVRPAKITLNYFALQNFFLIFQSQSRLSAAVAANFWPYVQYCSGHMSGMFSCSQAKFVAIILVAWPFFILTDFSLDRFFDISSS